MNSYLDLPSLFSVLILKTIYFINTVEPLHNGHPGAVLSGRYREVAVIERWLLQRGGRYREVAVSGGLTVISFYHCVNIKIIILSPLNINNAQLTYYYYYTDCMKSVVYT